MLRLDDLWVGVHRVLVALDEFDPSNFSTPWKRAPGCATRGFALISGIT